MVEYVPMDAYNIPQCVALARELHNLGTFGYNGPEFDWDYCTAQFIRVCKSPNFFHMFAIDEDERYIGGMIGHVETFMFNPKLMAVEDAWYVREGVKDRAKIAKHLMQSFVNWGLDHMDALLVQTGDIASISSHAVDTLYRHLGFERYGTIYKYERKSVDG